LGDIAVIESDDPELAGALQSLDLGRAPLPNQTIYLNEPRIRVAMRRARLPEKRIVIDGPVENTSVILADEPRSGAIAFQRTGPAGTSARAGARGYLRARGGDHR